MLTLQPSVDDCGTRSEASARSPRAPHSRRDSPGRAAGPPPSSFSKARTVTTWDLAAALGPLGRNAAAAATTPAAAKEPAGDEVARSVRDPLRRLADGADPCNRKRGCGRGGGGHRCSDAGHLEAEEQKFFETLRAGFFKRVALRNLSQNGIARLEEDRIRSSDL